MVVAWQRTGRIEARISRDRGRTYGPVRYLGPSPEAFPSLTVRVSAGGKVLIVWGARETQGPTRVLVSRAAIAAPGAPFATRVLERVPRSTPPRRRPSISSGPRPGPRSTARRPSPPGRPWWTAAPPSAPRAWRASR